MAIQFLDEDKTKESSIKFLSDEVVEKPVTEKVRNNMNKIFSALKSGPTGIGSEISKEQAQTSTIAGIPSAVAGVKPETAMQTGETPAKIAAQTAGGAVGGLPGAVTATTGIEVLKQSFEKALGKREKYDLSEIGSEALITGLTEGAFRLPAKLMFSRLRGLDNMNKTGRKIGTITAEIDAKADHINSDDVMRDIIDNSQRILDQSGVVGNVLRRWKNILSNNTQITFDQLKQFKEQLGAATSFTSEKVPKNQDMNKVAKLIGKKVGAKLEEIAIKNGRPDFVEANKQYAKLAKKYGGPGQSFKGQIGGVATKGIIGTAVGLATGNPMAGIATSGALLEAGSPAAQEFLYKLLEKTGVGRGATVGASELIRKIKNA